MDKFKNKYRIPSARLPHWNYGFAALYFITICTKNREHYFGEIVNGEDTVPSISLSPIGVIVKSEWLKTFGMRPDMNLWMGEFVIMPNHFHAIIGIGENEYNTKRNMDGAVDGAVDGRDAMHCVSKEPKPETNRTKNQFGPQSKNLASIVRGFKIGVTKNARMIYSDFEWQPRFHDHIIRDDKSFKNISNYIINNPTNWQEDKFFKPN